MSDTINVSNISFDKGKIKGCSISISGKIFTVKWDSGQYKVEAGTPAAGAPAAGAPAAGAPAAGAPAAGAPAAGAPAAGAPAAGTSPAAGTATGTSPAATTGAAAGSGDKNEYNTQTELITKLDEYGYKSSV